METMRRFVGRSRELEALERVFDAGNVKACMVYGRRRIGKTMMLRRLWRTSHISTSNSTEEAPKKDASWSLRMRYPSI